MTKLAHGTCWRRMVRGWDRRPILLPRFAFVVGLALLSSIDCSKASDLWIDSESSGLLHEQTLVVIDAVASLPECSALRQGGSITWTIKWILDCRPGAGPAKGCTWLGPPPRIELLYGAAWVIPGEISTLAHELCHACGYTEEFEADACSERARVNYHDPAPSG